MLAAVFSLVVQPAVAADPKSVDDGTFMMLKGTVLEAGAERFKLDYGGGTITIEMDDRDWFLEGKNIAEGDEVVVWGKVDDDTYQTATIEAWSVYVKNSARISSPATQMTKIRTSNSSASPKGRRASTCLARCRKLH